MAREKPICNLDDIPDGGEAAIETKINREKVSLIALRNGNEVKLYKNSCPHIGVPLDISPGKFLNVDKTHIQCSTHGALFEIETGHCVHGPCNGENLETVPARVADGKVWPG